MLLYVYIHFFGILLLFFIKKFLFLSFSFLFEKASNFSNRILTNQKPELVIKSCQWNCMQTSFIFSVMVSLKNVVAYCELHICF